jgi:MFS family permease
MIYRLVFSKTSFVPILLWTTGSILLFGCWDNVATTFFVKFLDESMQNVSWVKNIIQSGFILIGILAIPAYVLQGFWIKQAEKFGRFRIITLGLFLSGGALFLLAIFGRMENLLGLALVVCMGLLNSAGYAAGYPMSQSIFADEYTRSFAKENNTTVINADISAAPLKILNNFANAVGLIF